MARFQGQPPTGLLSTAQIPVLLKPVITARGPMRYCVPKVRAPIARWLVLPSLALGDSPVGRKQVLYSEKLSGSHRNQDPEQDLSPRKAGSTLDRVSEGRSIAPQLIRGEQNTKELPPSLHVCFGKLSLREHQPAWSPKCRSAPTCHL